MKIIVQKFGGTSVNSAESRKRCVEHIKRAKKEGYAVAVVVSAMGRKGEPYATDTLLGVADAIHLQKRERDLLLSTGELIAASVFSSELWKQGIQNAVLTGGQAGIVTDESFGDGKIVSLKPKRLLDELKEGNVVVVTGFQGETAAGELTTLGRGGSDTTAAALGVALNAEFVDIFTDVEGVMTADPRIVKDARMLERASYAEICNLAHLGAKVVHPRAVEIAMQKNIPLRVRSTFSDGTGTLIANMNEMTNSRQNFRERLITGVTQTSDIAQIRAKHGGNEKTQAEIFKAMEKSGISVDFINVQPGEAIYTVPENVAEKAKIVLAELGVEASVKPSCAKVSVVGGGISGVPGVMAKIVGALAAEKVGILQSADSHTTIWVLVERKDMEKAVCALHEKFGLDKLETIKATK